MAPAILQLAANPVTLSEFQSRFPVLRQGPDGESYRQVMESVRAAIPDPELRGRLAHPPRYWGLLKAGRIRRFLTMWIDVPVICGIWFGPFYAVMALNLNLRTELVFPLLFLWGAVAYFGYSILMETHFGASVAGLLFGIRVVDEYGNTPTSGFLAWRHFKRLFFYLVVAAVMSGAGSGGGRFANLFLALDDNSEVVMA